MSFQAENVLLPHSEGTGPPGIYKASVSLSDLKCDVCTKDHLIVSDIAASKLSGV